MFRLLRPLCVLLFLLASASVARAQFVVYELRFKELPGSVNFSFYTGAYVIAPVTGGAASIVFTTENGGNFYAASSNSVTYHVATNGGVRKAAISALAINGTARAFYSISGFLNSTMGYTAEGKNLSTEVATDIKGMLQASDEASIAQDADGHAALGMIGMASITGTLRYDLSQMANKDTSTMSDALSMIAGLLEKYGYKPDTGEVADEPVAAPQMIEPKDEDITELFGGASASTATESVAVEQAVEGADASLFPPMRFEED